MKLIFCKECQDIFKLDFEMRFCKCKKSSGKYLDNSKAVYYGEFAIPIGINNHQLANAVYNPNAQSTNFDAFVFDKKYKNFRKGEIECDKDTSD